MRYAYGIKTNCIQAAVFLLAGLVLILSGGEGNLVVWGGFFWISISMLPTQLIYTLGVSKLVQASPMRKKLQTVFPVAANFACVTAVYLAELVMCGIRLGVRPDEAGWMGRSLIALAVMMAFMMLYLEPVTNISWRPLCSWFPSWCSGCGAVSKTGYTHSFFSGAGMFRWGRRQP